MKKHKLHTEDGSEFTVFYLGEPESQIKKEVTDCSEEKGAGPCPVGEKGVKGSSGEANPQLSDFSWEPNKEVTEWFKQGKLFWGSDLPTKGEIKKAKTLLKESLEKYMGMKPLDDIIESDIIKEPVVDEVYRVKGMEKIVKFVADLDPIWRAQINKDIYFYLDPKADMLLKARAWEKEEFNNNENI